jgi:hypothetical protein
LACKRVFTDFLYHTLMDDVRTIRFSDSELLEALKELMKAHGLPVPPAQAVRLIKECDAGHVLAGIEVVFEQSKNKRRFKADDVKAALIAYCRARKVPLPLRYSKQVHVVLDEAAILIRQSDTRAMNSARTPQPGQGQADSSANISSAVRQLALQPGRS